jgi:hypothetical protein
MATEVDICNLALASLGVNEITALGTDTAEERICSRFYAQTRDVYLSEHNWGFAMKSLALTEIDPLPDDYGRYGFGYSYPSDCLKAQVIRDGETAKSYAFIIKDYAIAGPSDARIILTDLEDAVLEYTVALTDTTLFSAAFIEGLSMKLAYRFSWPLTKNLQIEQAALQRFAIADAMAKQHDSSQQLVERLPPTWEQSRGIEPLRSKKESFAW